MLMVLSPDTSHGIGLLDCGSVNIFDCRSLTSVHFVLSKNMAALATRPSSISWMKRTEGVMSIGQESHMAGAQFINRPHQTDAFGSDGVCRRWQLRKLTE